LTQTSTTEWSLAKTGSVDTTNSTVTWNVTVTQDATESGILIVNGFMTVTNTGGAPATIGNIVVNLQTRSGNKWITRSSDIADATNDDGATQAKVVAAASSENKSSFIENGASGRLLFMDAANNSAFALKPEVSIGPGRSKSLLFAASFDNDVLNLPVGAGVRAEVIVSFGNSGPGGVSAPNIDINGNGKIDADEAYVRSVATRIGLAVPAETPGNGEVTLTDTVDDIAKTGSVTFSNAQFNLTSTGGTVSVSYSAGASGGTITNCAHLKSDSTTVNVGGFDFPNVAAIDLQTCDTQTIEAPRVCTPGRPGCGWVNADLITYPQLGWDIGGNGASILGAHYGAVYLSTFGILEVGLPDVAGFSMQFSGFAEVQDFLPQGDPDAPLNADLLNPAKSASGTFGGEVVALKLNVDFADAGYTTGTAGTQFGDLTVCGTTTGLDGSSVRTVLGIANTLLGGGSSNVTSIAEVSPLVAQLNIAFDSGHVSTFAQDHLVNGACP
jgi:hypothetical protein